MKAWASLATGRSRPRLCEKTFHSPRRMANGRIRCEKPPEIASTWLKLTHENGARAFSHSLGQLRTFTEEAGVLDTGRSVSSPRFEYAQLPADWKDTAQLETGSTQQRAIFGRCTLTACRPRQHHNIQALRRVAFRS